VMSVTTATVFLFPIVSLGTRVAHNIVFQQNTSLSPPSHFVGEGLL
jgi:hypothetical protein